MGLFVVRSSARFRAFNNFIFDEGGAVTVDFIVLTSAVVGLGASVLVTTGSEITGLGKRVNDYLIELADGSILTISANDSSGWSYLPFWPSKWDLRIADIRKSYKGSPKDKLLGMMKEQLDGKGNVRAGQQDE